MAKYYQPFWVAGVKDKEAWDPGLESTEGEKKKIVAILVNVSVYANNEVMWNIDREKIGGIPDYLLDTESDLGAANFPYSTTKISRIEVDHELAMGQKFQVGISCGVTIATLRGAYVYEIV